jgi:hypothetical protein
MEAAAHTQPQILSMFLSSEDLCAGMQCQCLRSCILVDTMAAYHTIPLYHSCNVDVIRRNLLQVKRSETPCRTGSDVGKGMVWHDAQCQ